MNSDHVRQIVSAPAGESESGAGSVAGSLASAKEKITETARDTTARIKSAASETASRAKQKAQEVASDTKRGTAERLGGYSSAMHESAKRMEEQDPNIAWATHRLADKIQNFAEYMRNSDFDELRRDGENVARRHPVAFFGGMFLAGLVVGNLLKARTPEAEADDFDPDAEEQQLWDDGNASGTEALTDTPTTEAGNI
jgi:hypothetical protein